MKCVVQIQNPSIKKLNMRTKYRAWSKKTFQNKTNKSAAAQSFFSVIGLGSVPGRSPEIQPVGSHRLVATSSRRGPHRCKKCTVQQRRICEPQCKKRKGGMKPTEHSVLKVLVCHVVDAFKSCLLWVGQNDVPNGITHISQSIGDTESKTVDWVGVHLQGNIPERSRFEPLVELNPLFQPPASTRRRTWRSRWKPSCGRLHKPLLVASGPPMMMSATGPDRPRPGPSPLCSTSTATLGPWKSSMASGLRCPWWSLWVPQGNQETAKEHQVWRTMQRRWSSSWMRTTWADLRAEWRQC